MKAKRVPSPTIAPLPDTGGLSKAHINRISKKLRALRAALTALEAEWSGALDEVHANHRASARNMVHYVELRRHDLRRLQDALTALGLSSLGRSEPYVLATLDAVMRNLRSMGGKPPAKQEHAPGLSFEESSRLLEQHESNLLGPRPAERSVRIMVTMPTEAAFDYKLVRGLLERGMNCARINCAHDDERVWAGIIENLDRAKAELNQPCRVLMDLGGPKLRTGAIESGPRVVHLRPRRNVFGEVVRPARVWIAGEGSVQLPPDDIDARLPVAEEWQRTLHAGDVVALLDARGRSRKLEVTEEVGDDRVALSQKSVYAFSGGGLRRLSGEGPDASAEGRIGVLPSLLQPIVLHVGDTLVLTADPEPGRGARTDKALGTTMPARIPCTLPEVFAHLKPGERIYFDDGRIGGEIVEVTPEAVAVTITEAREQGDYLWPDKGINVPDSELALTALTTKDREDLAFIVQHADMVGYSFVRQAEDVHALQAELDKLGGGHLGILLKIETRQAFERLPGLILAAMHSPAAGVMIARGDLALECGYERLAELQEEILWLCEAAHMPVVWATQVLETLAKLGQPSRAEITDAAMGERAECVMLNKGPYILKAVRTLDNILRRMQEHQTKKRARLRRLKLARGLPRLR
jgi:pyruvate kinase